MRTVDEFFSMSCKRLQILHCRISRSCAQPVGPVLGRPQQLIFAEKIRMDAQASRAANDCWQSAADAASRRGAQKRLAVLLTGHSIAEEAVIYPALVKANEQGDATKAYTEQSAAKVQMALLEDLDPMSQEYVDKLEHIRGAVAHHVYEEEGNWFVELKEKLPPADQTKITFRYQQEFSRYTGQDEEADMGAIPGSVSDFQTGVPHGRSQF